MGAVLAAVFEAGAFEPAFAAVLAVLLGIALLFLEDLAAELALAAVRVSRARLLDALRLAVAAFLLEVLFLRVFCDTACCAELPRPCSMFFAETP